MDNKTIHIWQETPHQIQKEIIAEIKSIFQEVVYEKIGTNQRSSLES